MLESNISGSYQGGSRCGGTIYQAEIRMKGGKVQGYIRPQVLDKPGAHSLQFSVAVIFLGYEQGSNFKPDLAFRLQPDEGVQHRRQVGKGQPGIEML